MIQNEKSPRLIQRSDATQSNLPDVFSSVRIDDNIVLRLTGVCDSSGRNNFPFPDSSLIIEFLSEIKSFRSLNHSCINFLTTSFFPDFNRRKQTPPGESEISITAAFPFSNLWFSRFSIFPALS